MTETPVPYPDGVLKALGYITALWSNVEAAAGVALLAFCKGANKQARENITIALAHMATRDRLDALKALCCLEMTFEDYEKAESWINHVSTTLRNYRNRLMHDEWPALQKVRKSTPKVISRSRIEREKGSGDIKLVLETENYVIAEDLNSFADDLRDAIKALYLISTYKRQKAKFRSELPPLALRHTNPQQTVSGRLIHTKKKQKPTAPRRASQGK